MLSLPPMDGSPMPIWASKAPSSAAAGLPQRSGTVVKPLKVLLEGEPGLPGIGAHSHQLGQALHHGVGSALEGRVTGPRRECIRSSWRWRRRSPRGAGGSWPPWPLRESAGTGRRRASAPWPRRCWSQTARTGPSGEQHLQPGQVGLQGLHALLALQAGGDGLPIIAALAAR